MSLGLASSRFLPLVGLLFGLTVVAASEGAGAAATPGCSSFRSQADAQERFGELGGSPANPIPKLDPDRDGVACEGSSGPYKGYATVAYNPKRGFFYGTATLPPEAGGSGFACLEGNRHFDDGPRLLTLFKVRPGPDLVIRHEVGTATKPSSGRVLWKVEKAITPGNYYVVFEERQQLTPYGPNQCPGFRSAEVRLPQPLR